MAKDEDADNVAVTQDDQRAINEFARLSARSDDLVDALATAANELEALEDLEDELELADEDEPVRYKIGEAFVSMSLSASQARIASEKRSVQEKVGKIKADKSSVEERMGELKKVLYSKFGSAINLEK